MKYFTLLPLSLLALFAANATAGSLEVGDPAPKIKASLWVKGAPVTAFETGKVYVVEFWATWCGPCKLSIPHLTTVANQFKDKVTIIGVDVMEQDTNVVIDFVKEMGPKMDYTVSIDTEDTYMTKEWLEAAKQNGIPAAFIVDQAGKIAWIGHPMDSLDTTLEAVLAGKWDAVTAKKRTSARQQAQALFNEGMAGGDLNSILERAKKLEVIDKEVGGFIPGKTFDAQEFIGMIRSSSAMDAYQKAVLNGEDPATLDKLEAIARERAPKDSEFDSISKRIRLGLGAAKAQKLFTDYTAAVGSNSDPEKATELARQLGELKLKNPAMYHVFAKNILTDSKIKRRDPALAAQLEKSAIDLEGAPNGEYLDTYAQALFASGKIPDAIEAEKKAVQAAKDDAQKASFSATLKKYEAAPQPTK